MIIKIVYNSDVDNDFYYNLINKLSNATIESYDVKYTSDKKKGQSVKNVFGARLIPFVGIYIDDLPTKGFYSEVSECTVDNILNYLNNYEY